MTSLSVPVKKIALSGFYQTRFGRQELDGYDGIFTLDLQLNRYLKTCGKGSFIYVLTIFTYAGKGFIVNAEVYWLVYGL